MVLIFPNTDVMQDPVPPDNGNAITSSAGNTSGKPPASERIQSIDIAKGILILLVVIGHSGAPFSRYIFWFHMPAFFVLSGFLFRKNDTWHAARTDLLRKANKFFLLYISYFLLLTLLRPLFAHASPFSLQKTVQKLLVGGRFVGYELGTFWFITCLFFAIAAFTLLQTFVKRRHIQYLLLSGAYILAHVEAYLFHQSGISFYIPWNIDVSLLAVCYVAMGYYLGPWILQWMTAPRLRIKSLILVLFLAMVLIEMDLSGVIDFQYDMKCLKYGSPGWDLVIPPVFTLIVILLSSWVGRCRFARLLAGLGYYSVVIMFLHFGIFGMCDNLTRLHWVPLTLMGLACPMLFALACEKWQLTRRLFITG
jgi:fucose 4-O-acetylase-like acetyltransferase